MNHLVEKSLVVFPSICRYITKGRRTYSSGSRLDSTMGRAISSSIAWFKSRVLSVWKTSFEWRSFPLARLNKKKFAIEQIETKFKGSTLESQFYPELESYICTWLGDQLSDAVKRKASNRCATPGAGVMLTEYYFSVFPTPDVQVAQLSNYIRRPCNQATTASGVIQNLKLWKVSIQIHREVAGLPFLQLAKPPLHPLLQFQASVTGTSGRNSKLLVLAARQHLKVF